MKERNYSRHSRTKFADDTQMTPGILEIIAKISNGSVTSVKQRDEASKKYYEALEKASSSEQQAKTPNKKKKSLLNFFVK